MSGLLLIPLLVSGYLYLYNHPYHYYKLHRYDGWLLYMKACSYGLMCVVFSFCLAIALRSMFPHFHLVSFIAGKIKIDKDDIDSRFHAWMLFISISSVLAGAAFGFTCKVKAFVTYCRRSYKDASGLLSYERLKTGFVLSVLYPIFSDAPLDRMLFDSLLFNKSILVTLRCGKVYVGVIVRISEPNEKNEPNKQISLIPTMSGYRDNQNKRVVFVNEYSNLDKVDTSIAIFKDEIGRVSWYQHEVHNEVDENILRNKAKSSQFHAAREELRGVDRAS